MAKTTDPIADTTTVGIYDTSMVVTNSKNQSEQIIIIKDYKKVKDTPIYESPILISIVFPFIVSILTLLILKFVDRMKNKLVVIKIQQDIKSAEQELKDNQAKLELANKTYLLEINKAEKDYKTQYDNLLEERKKYNLELLRYKEQQISELKTVLKRVQMILFEMEDKFNLVQGFEISADDHEKYHAEYFVENHQKINQELRSILAETFLFYSELRPLFEEAISSITILLNRINRDREKGVNTNAVDYMWLHSPQTESSIENINFIISKIREIIEPIKAI